MPKKDKKQSEKLSFAEQEWITKVLPKEIDNILELFDLEELDHEVQKIINKVNNKENLTDDELKDIKQFLVDYRGPMKKHDVKEAVEATKKHKTYIKTQQDLVELFDNDDEDRYKITMQFPVNGIKRIFEFNVTPIADIQAVNLVMDHAHLFKDVTEEEMHLFNKENMNQKLTKAEKKVIAKAKEKLAEAEAENQISIINTFLARQVTPPSYDNIEDNIKFWNKFPFMHRFSLYMKVREILGLTEEANDKLFLS